MSKKIYLRTFGCQMNDRDSELIAGMLIEKGYEVCDDPDSADVVLLNTCSVRQHAEDRVKGLIHKFSARKKKDPSFRIGVLGCMSQRHGEMLIKEFPMVDIVVGPNNIYDLPELLERSFAQERIFAVNNLKRPATDVNPAHRTGTFTSFVNITYGCDNYCSYCIVPYVRGREVSRPVKDIVKEVKELAEKGFKEVTLLGRM